jgi:hypothetical protein
VVVGAGVYLWWRAPTTTAPPADTVALVPTIGDGGVGLAALGRF